MIRYIIICFSRIWVSNIFPPLSKPSSIDGDSRTNFKRDLLSYIISYKKPELNVWLNIMRQHDMTSARLGISLHDIQ